jgi:type II secretory pathway pseudopilin PulG
MYCTTCGQQNPDNGRFCNNCGQSLQPADAGSVVPPPPIATSSTVPPPPTGSTQENDGKAVASLILGILSLTFFWIVAGIPAIILGHMSRSQIKKSMGKLKGDGMALAGLIMGYISVATLPFIVMIIAAIAIPNLLRARIAANEAASVGAIRTINTANVTYAATYGGFAPSLTALGGSSSNCSAPSKEHACLVDTVLASGQRSGYRYTYTAEDSDNDGVIDKFFVEAEPIKKGSSGRSAYCTDESGVIRKQADGSRCTAESATISGRWEDD